MGLENAPAMPTCVRLYHRWHCIVDALLCHARKIWRILRPSRSSWMRLLPIVHLTSDQLAPYVVGALGICCVEHKDSSSFDFNRIDILTVHHSKRLLSNNKLYSEYEDIMSRLIQDGEGGTMLGGSMESLTERGEI